MGSSSTAPPAAEGAEATAAASELQDGSRASGWIRGATKASATRGKLTLRAKGGARDTAARCSRASTASTARGVTTRGGRPNAQCLRRALWDRFWEGRATLRCASQTPFPRSRWLASSQMRAALRSWVGSGRVRADKAVGASCSRRLAARHTRAAPTTGRPIRRKCGCDMDHRLDGGALSVSRLRTRPLRMYCTAAL